MTKDLLPDEALVLRERRHWISLIHPLFPSLLPLLPAAALLWLVRPAADIAALVALAALAIGGLFVVVALVRWQSADFTLTDQRVLLRRGVVSRSTKVIALERIQDVSTARPPLGRLLDFGRLEIDAAGAGGHEVLEGFPNPERLRDAVFAQTRRLRGGGLDAAPRRRTA